MDDQEIHISGSMQTELHPFSTYAVVLRTIFLHLYFWGNVLLEMPELFEVPGGNEVFRNICAFFFLTLGLCTISKNKYKTRYFAILYTFYSIAGGELLSNTELPSELFRGPSSMMTWKLFFFLMTRGSGIVIMKETYSLRRSSQDIRSGAAFWCDSCLVTTILSQV